MNPAPQPPDSSEAAIFDAALACATPQERAAYLDKACASQPELRQRIEALLAAHDQATGFLENPNDRANPNPTVRLELPGDEKPGDVIGHYKIREKIGEGGCGVVYVADQEQPVRRRVALKVVKLGMDTKQVVARFEAERQALALMDHPNIAKVFDAGSTSTGRPFFVMELVRGIKITDYCDQNNLSTEERLKLFMAVCQAVQHAHQKGIIHRDIKPSNVLVTLHDGVPVPKVIDFGIAKATSDQRLTDKTIYTAFAQFLGTPAYMSPEQAEMSGLDIDTRSDIYSLGVLLYELLTGKTPFDAKTLLAAGIDQMRRIIREQEPQRPSTRLSTLTQADLTTLAKQRHAEAPKLINLISGDLDWIVMKCLEKDRTRRYDTATGLAIEIQRHLSNEPVIARPPSVGYRVQKLVRRNKLAVASSAAVLLALVLGMAMSSWLAVRASQAERKTAEALAQAKLAQAEEAKQRSHATAMAESEKQLRIMAADKSSLMVKLITSVVVDRTASITEALESEEENLIDRLFRDDPEGAAAIGRSIGYYNVRLRNWEKARLFLRRYFDAKRLLSSKLDDVDALSDLKELVTVSLSSGHPAEARALCDKLCADARAGASNAAPGSLAHKSFRKLELWSYRKLAQVNEQEGRHGDSKILIQKLLVAIEAKELESLEAGLAWKVAGGVKLHENNPMEALKAFENAKAYYPEGWQTDIGFVDLERGEAFIAIGDYEQAERLIEANLNAVKWWYGEKQFDVQRAYKNLAQIYQKTGRHDLAIKLEKKFVAPIPDTDLADSARTLLNVGLFADADQLARKALGAIKADNSGDYKEFEARSLLGACLLGQKKTSEAEPFLVSALEGLRKCASNKQTSVPTLASLTKETLRYLIQLTDATGEKDRNTSYREHLAKLNRQLADQGNSTGEIQK